MRIGPTLSIASAEEEKRLAEKRRAADLPFDQRPVPEASLADLDLGLFEREYLPNAVAPEVLAQNERGIEHQLQALRFLGREGRPNIAALLVFGKNPRAWLPGAYVQFLRLDGDDLTDPIRSQREVGGSLGETIRQLEETLRANLSVAVDLTVGSTERRQADYPFLALQQIFRNALIHRTYEATNAPVRVTWFAGRIEVYSPGGLYGVVNPQNILSGATDYRNPLLAESMKVMGFVQRFGLGLPLARRELARNGNPPPEFRFEPTGVLVTVRRQAL